MTRITQQQLESYLWGAAVLLRGTIDAGDYKQFIFPLLFYKRLCDVFDEETVTALRESGGDEDYAMFPENHRFQVPAEAHWTEIRKVSRDVGRALQQAMRAIETANPDKLFGIFGDAQWTNKDRLSDAMLRDLIEHFSTLELTIARLPEDELGQGYEYLIKKFADDSGHTAAEFYTNRTVVHLMTEMLDVQPTESVYDPTCGTAGMLLSCIARLRKQGKEWRNVKLYGQERNLMTSSIARMNCFLHGIEDFRIERGDTLAEPKLVEGDRLQRFDVVLANPPYSIKQWNREAFAADPWGRNVFGVPPQSIADYAFQQHILQSLKPKTGRCAVLWPHGVLFRDAEEEMRRKMIETDLIECIVGLGPNLFYNSSMPSCIVICRTLKPKSRRGKILLINAVNAITHDRTQSILTDSHIASIVGAYDAFEDRPGFSRLVTLEEVRQKEFSLNILLYIRPENLAAEAPASTGKSFSASADAWLNSRELLFKYLSSDLKHSFRKEDRELEGGKIGPLFSDRGGWRRVQLGDVTRKTEEIDRSPLNAGLNRYLLVEHLDADCLRIRRWGDIADGTLPPTFYKVFRSGQVLYPTRRPYLRRAAVADFDGICGEKTLTISGAECVDRNFLPFVFQAEEFIRFATSRQVGSVNPHIRWRDVAEFEFDLPPLNEQRRIAEILWGIEEVVVATEALIEGIQQWRSSYARNAYSLGSAAKMDAGTTLSDLIEINPPLGIDLAAEDIVSFITMADVSESGVIKSMTRKTYAEVRKGFTSFRDGDILFAKITPCMENGKGAHVCGLVNGVGFGSTEFHVLRPKRAEDGRFIYFLTQAREFRAEARRFMRGSAGQQRVPADFLKSFPLCIPELIDRERIARELDAVTRSLDSALIHLTAAKALQKEILETVFQR